MSSHPKRFGAASVSLILLAAVCYAVFVSWRRAEMGLTRPNFDSYGYFYPNLLYALESLKAGEGLLWNRFQNSGQPFFAISLSALLYPPHALFLCLGPDHGLVALLATHLAVGGVGMYLLCREMRLAPPAALCGAFAFEFGGVTLFLAGYTPSNVGSYVWLPLALFCTERTLRRSTFTSSVFLGVVLAPQILAGYPQFAFFTYQVIALRTLWECITNWTPRTPRVLLAVAGGLVLGPSLAAVQLIPSIEVANQSVRDGPLRLFEIFPNSLENIGWERFRGFVTERNHYGSIFAILPLMFGGAAVLDAARRRLVVFYLLVSVLFTGLAFDNPLTRLYLDLPYAANFRLPYRFLIVTAFAYAVLSAFGANVLMSSSAQALRSKWRPLVAMVASASILYWLSSSGFLSYEWVLAAAGLMLCGVTNLTTFGARNTRWLFPLLTLAGALTFVFSKSPPFAGIWTQGARLFNNEEAFGIVRDRITLQDRMLQLGKHIDYSMMPKSASIFRIPSIVDYETQASRRYAALIVRLRRNSPMHSINDFYYSGVSAVPQNRRIFDLLATRYVIVASSSAEHANWPRADDDFRPLWERANRRVYENLRALPRAYYVPRVQVEADSEQLMSTLLSRGHDPRQIALVEESVSDDWTQGEEGSGEVEIVADQAETLTIDVDASKSGFLVVTDQYYPGWKATVNGDPVRIMRANYAFRLVPVPAGASTVVFGYWPQSLTLGAAISAASLVIVILAAAQILWNRPCWFHATGTRSKLEAEPGEYQNIGKRKGESPAKRQRVGNP